jgi:zinc D-Ala-D-Ala carboxypeptidase
MSTTDKIKRNKERKTTNSIESAHMQHPYAVQDAAVPGARNLAEATKLINQKGFSKVIENATFLELISPPNNPGGKTKYILPHLNMADGATFEGYLCKIRLPEDVGCLPDPQDILDEINSGPSAKKAVEGENPADEKIKRINYFEAVANHKTFAPLEPKNQKIPAPNSKVRVICFSEPHMYSGGSIDGFYESIDADDGIFEQGTLNDLLESFRKYTKQLGEIVQADSDNVSSFISQIGDKVSSIFGPSAKDLEHEDERGQDSDGMSMADGEMLSQNFSLSQLTKSSRFPGIDNTPNQQQKENLRLLANNVLEPIRSKFGDLIITSAYRSPEINQRVGGSRTGDHPRGMAADIVPRTGTKNLLEVANWIRDNLSYKQLILEMWRPEANRGWIHVSYDEKNNKKQAFEMYKDQNGQTQYREIKKV